MSVPGIGPIISSAMVAAIGTGDAFTKGRDFAKVHASMGPNGSGKSTLAYVLAGKTDYQLTAGEVLFDGEDLHAAGRARRARRLPRLSSTRWKIPGVAVRAGTHCVMPLLARYGVTPTCRASFALYNTKDEVDTLAESMVKAREFFA